MSDSSSGPAASDDAATDPLREKLLEAAADVFASKGYMGTKIMDIVKAAGLSSGAVYGRFESKDELLMEAVLGQIEADAVSRRLAGLSVAEVLVEASSTAGPLDDAEAMQLEAFIAARREPRLATAITKARKNWRVSIVEPLIQGAIADGSASPDADFDSIVFFLETLQLGLLVQRGAGQAPADQDSWHEYMQQIIRGIARPAQGARRRRASTKHKG